MTSVATTIDAAQSFANSIAQSVSTMLSASGNYVNNLGYTSLPPASYYMSYAPPTYSWARSAPDTAVSPVTIPTADLPTVSFLDIPPPTTTYTYPEAASINLTGLFQAVAPNASVPGLAASAPTIDIQALRNYMNSIAQPLITTVAAPALQTVEVPTIPTLHLPEYLHTDLESAPGIAGDAQVEFISAFDAKSSVLQAMIDAQFNQWVDTFAPGHKATMAALQSRLQSGMESGSALTTAYEDQLYARARSKLALEQARVEADLDRQHAKRGFIVPPGSLVAGRNNLHQAAADNLAVSATEIAIKRAEMELQHIQFAMQLASSTNLGLYNIASSYAGLTLQACDRALEYAKTSADTFLQMLRTGFERYNILMQKYQIEATVYETLLKSALAELEIYKLQLDSAKAVKEIEALDVSVYTKRIEGEQLKISQYTALVETVMKRAEVERIALDLYGEAVKAYVAEVQAKSVEFGVYESAIKADATKLQGELAKLEVVKSQLETVKLQADVEGARASIVANYNTNLTNQYSLELKKYETEIAAQSSRAQTDVEIRKLALEAYTTDLTASLNKYQSDIAAVKPYLEFDLARISDRTNRDVADANRTLGFIKAQTEINGILAQSSTDLAKAALGAQTTITSDLISQVTNL